MLTREESISYNKRFNRDWGNDPYKFVKSIHRANEYRKKIQLKIAEIVQWTHVTRSTFATFTGKADNSTIERRISKFKECAKTCFPDSPYIFVLEKFPKGVGYHIHSIIFNVGKLDLLKLDQINDGAVHLKELKPSFDVVRYLTKYITKDKVCKRSYYAYNVVRAPY